MSSPTRDIPAFFDDELALAAMVNLVVVLADNKYYLGRRIAEWATGAPSLESAVACSALAQEELGHARVLYPLLEELPAPPGPLPLKREQDRTRRYCVSFLDAPFPSWPHAVAALALIDTALNVVFESLIASRYEAIARRVVRILDEETFHLGFTEGRVRDLVEYPSGLALLQERVDVLLPEMLCWFGPPDEPGLAALCKSDLIGGDGEQLRQAYLARVAPLLLEVGARLPLRWNLVGKLWSYDELPWGRWNALQRRIEGPVTSDE